MYGSFVSMIYPAEYSWQRMLFALTIDSEELRPLCMKRTHSIAEGIENSEMLELVQRLNVQCAQGYLLGRPSETIPEVKALQDLSPFLYSGSS